MFVYYIRTRSLIITVLISVISLILCGVYYSNFQLQTAWDDKDTWGLTETVTFPSNRDRLKLHVEQTSEKISTIVVDYCVLYKLTGDDKSRTYSCSLLPYYAWTVKQYDPILASEKNQIVFTVPKDTVLPSSFLGRQRIDEETLNSIGTDPTPVSLTLTVYSEKPKKNLTSLIAHFKLVKANKKENLTSVITSWKVDKLKAYQSLSDQEQKAFASTFSRNVLSSFEEVMGVNKKFADYANSDFSRALFDSFRYGLFNCHRKDGQTTCFKEFEHNPAESILYYYYLTQNEVMGRKIKEHLLDHMLPFQGDTSSAVERCPELTDCELYFDFTLYQYQVCPSLAHGKTDFDTDIVLKYFEKRPLAVVTLNELEEIKGGMNFLEVGESMATYSMQKEQYARFSKNLNAACVALINQKAPASAFERLRSISSEVLFFDFTFVDVQGNLKKVKRENYLEFAYYATKFQPYAINLLPNYSLQKTTSQSGLSDKSYEEDIVMSFDIPKSLMLSYLLESNVQD